MGSGFLVQVLMHWYVNLHNSQIMCTSHASILLLVNNCIVGCISNVIVELCSICWTFIAIEAFSGFCHSKL